jgi:hypothetical protein
MVILERRDRQRGAAVGQGRPLLLGVEPPVVISDAILFGGACCSVADSPTYSGGAAHICL